MLSLNKNCEMKFFIYQILELWSCRVSCLGHDRLKVKKIPLVTMGF